MSIVFISKCARHCHGAIEKINYVKFPPQGVNNPLGRIASP